MSSAEHGQTYYVFTNGPEYRKRDGGMDNVIDFSTFRQLHTRFSSHSFSIKYVLSGTEQYDLPGRSYAVDQGAYLLTNAFTSGSVVIDSDRNVNGVCIELSPQLLAEVSATLHEPGRPYPEKDFYDFLTGADFFEHTYHTSKTNLGRYLVRSVPQLSAGYGKDELFMGQFFYTLAGKMMADQQEMHRYFRSFDSVKSITKKDLLNRLLKGKELMDDNYRDKMTMTEIARAATMSEYYFLRLFKKTFNCTPHRYIVEKRLHQANLMLAQDDESIATVAYHCGFADIHSFSKAFKKHFGRSPSSGRMMIRNS